jgi:hypothetical protein
MQLQFCSIRNVPPYHQSWILFRKQTYKERLVVAEVTVMEQYARFDFVGKLKLAAESAETSRKPPYPFPLFPYIYPTKKSVIQ